MTLAFVGVMVADGTISQGTDLVIAVALGVVTIGALTVLIRLAVTGRALTHAAATWLAEPYRAGRRTPDAAGWLAARKVNFEPRIFARISASNGAFLLAIGAWAITVKSFLDVGESGVEGAQVGAYAIASLYVALVSTLTACGVFLGVIRIVRGLAAADSLWAFLKPQRRH